MSERAISRRSDETRPHQAALASWRAGRGRRLLGAAAIVLACVSMFGSATAQDTSRDTANRPLSIEVPQGLSGGPQQWASPEGLSASIQVMLLLTVLSLAPSVLLMTTCFVRIIVVLGLLRQAIGTQQLPPSQVITALAMFISLLIMTPVWKEVYDDAIVPYTAKQISLDQAWTAGVKPIRRFMSMQIEQTNNSDDVWLFMSYLPDQPASESAGDMSYEDVPLQALLPAFMLSELKVSFLIGFQIYLPFLILDMVIASVMVSMGMLMLPPVLISMPFKLLLFVLVDGWHLVVGMLMESFRYQGFT